MIGVSLHRRAMVSQRLLILAGCLSVFALGCVAAAQSTGASANPDLGTASVSLKETQWNLVELEGNPVTAASSQNQPYIYLHAEGDKLTGSGGCNRVFGSFDLDGSLLQFHSVAQTLMVCPGSSGAHEPELQQALKLATSYRIDGDTLELKVDDRVLARFQAEKRK